jgi:membrane associated rhomboid family serine protease
MNALFQNIGYKFKNGTVVEKTIYINVLVFIAMHALNVLAFLFNTHENYIYNWFSMPADFNLFITRPWSVITYGFIHGSFFHILFNLLFLYYIGNLFLDYFTPKQFVNFYLYGTLFGGLLYALSFHYFPVFQGVNASLVGASSAVSAIFIGIATHIPNYQIKLRFIGYVKLWILALLFLVFDLIQLPDGNSGGHLAHLGGALYGYFTITQMQRGKGNYWVVFSRFFKKRKDLKTVYKSKNKPTTSSQKNNQVKVDAVLDKISKSGYDSLSQSEKDLLFDQGKN